MLGEIRSKEAGHKGIGGLSIGGAGQAENSAVFSSVSLKRRATAAASAAMTAAKARVEVAVNRYEARRGVMKELPYIDAIIACSALTMPAAAL